VKRGLLLLAVLLLGVGAALVALSAARAGRYDVARRARAVPRPDRDHARTRGRGGAPGPGLA
jgi:autotransporter translocation and assembly factor TamB